MCRALGFPFHFIWLTKYWALLFSAQDKAGSCLRREEFWLAPLSSTSCNIKMLSCNGNMQMLLTALERTPMLRCRLWCVGSMGRRTPRLGANPQPSKPPWESHSRDHHHGLWFVRANVVHASKGGVQSLHLHGTEKLEPPFSKLPLGSCFLRQCLCFLMCYRSRIGPAIFLGALLMLFWGVRLSPFFSGEQSTTREGRKACPSWRKQRCHNTAFQYYQVQTRRSYLCLRHTTVSWEHHRDSWKHFAPVVASALGKELETTHPRTTTMAGSLQNSSSHFLKDVEVVFWNICLFKWKNCQILIF